MASFCNAYKAIPQKMMSKGYYANEDGYGESIFGIKRLSHPNWKGWSVVDTNKFFSSDDEELSRMCLASEELRNYRDEHYKALLWDNLLLDNIKEQQVANNILDCEVEFGDCVAASCLQEVVGSQVTGVLSMSDIQKANEMHPSTFIDRYLTRRGMRIIQRDGGTLAQAQLSVLRKQLRYKL